MKPLYLIAASALALTAAACGPRTPPVRAALDCPANQGDLTRTSVSPDGKACTYTTSGGAEVTLQLVSVQGGVDSTLSTIEDNLLANRVAPKPGETEKDGEVAKTGDKTSAAAPEAKDAGDAVKAAEKAAAEAKADAGAAGVSIQASKDGKEAGVSIQASKDGKAAVVTEDGGTTRVNLPGIHIVANDNDDSANVKIGPLTVDAGGDGATVRMRHDVRLRGEPLNPQKRGMRAMFIYKGADLPDGYRFVGYEAGGPKAGPITVAVVKSKSQDADGDDLYSDVKRLVRRNGGV